MGQQESTDHCHSYLQPLAYWWPIPCADSLMIRLKLLISPTGNDALAGSPLLEVLCILDNLLAYLSVPMNCHKI